MSCHWLFQQKYEAKVFETAIVKCLIDPSRCPLILKVVRSVKVLSPFLRARGKKGRIVIESSLIHCDIVEKVDICFFRSTKLRVFPKEISEAIFRL